MSKREARPTLVVSAEAIELELRVFERVANEALVTRLDSQKHLEKAGRLLTDLCGVEDKLNTQVSELVAAITAARDRQSELAGRIQTWALELQARTETFRQLMLGLEELGPEVSAITEAMKDGAIDMEELAVKVRAVAERAAKVERDAMEEQFHDVARHARGRKEQLLAALARLDRAKGAAGA